MLSHLGHWVLKSTRYLREPGTWNGPPAAVAVFEADGTFVTADLEGEYWTGRWLVDGPDIVTESEGTVGLWQIRADKNTLYHELSDKDTGYRGRATWTYVHDSAVFEKRCIRHLRRIEGVGPTMAAKLWKAGAVLPPDLSGWTALLPTKAQALGISEEKLLAFCADASRL